MHYILRYLERDGRCMAVPNGTDGVKKDILINHTLSKIMDSIIGDCITVGPRRNDIKKEITVKGRHSSLTSLIDEDDVQICRLRLGATHNSCDDLCTINKVPCFRSKTISKNIRKHTMHSILLGKKTFENRPIYGRWSMSHVKKTRETFHNDPVNIAKLRDTCWKGIPVRYRGEIWKYLFGYLPYNKKLRESTLSMKRNEYTSFSDSLLNYISKNKNLDPGLHHQIEIDVPRTNFNIPLFKSEVFRSLLKRILYCWSIKHPASGYVQGLSDILSPIVMVFTFDIFLKLSKEQQIKDGEPCESGDSYEPYDTEERLFSNFFGDKLFTANDHDDGIEINKVFIDVNMLREIEADSFWCFCTLLNDFQDSYTEGQPGIIKEISKLKQLVYRLDSDLISHLEKQNVFFFQLMFRWMNCLMLRELPLILIIRLWDSCLSESGFNKNVGNRDGFKKFHLYVMAAFLRMWSSHIKSLGFQEIFLFLQDLPTRDWTFEDIHVLCSEAFILKELFHQSKAHLSDTRT